MMLHRHLVVMTPFFRRHDGIEAFVVKVEKIDLVPSDLERPDRGFANCSAETLRHRVAINEKDPHQKFSSTLCTFDMKACRLSVVERFMS